MALIEEEVQFTDARASLASVIDRAKTHRAQVVTRHGRKEAVVLSWEDYQRLTNVPSFARLLMAAPIEDGDLPERQRVPYRGGVEF